MEPITVILAAIAAGAAKGVGDSASEAVEKAYTGLREALRRRFRGDTDAEAALVRYVADPDSAEDVLARHLRSTGAGADDTVLAAAERVLVESRAGGPDVRASTMQGVQIGDRNKQKNTFGR